MIDFTGLELVVDKNYSFVGIKNKDSKLIFYLPKGFNTDFYTTYNDKRDLFFLLYRVLVEFKNICFQKSNVVGTQTYDRDGVIRASGSIQKIGLPDNENQEIIFYSKLDFIDSILNAYDEPKILSLAYKLGRSEKIDYSKLHLFMHHAVYLNNGAVYIDIMNLPRNEAHYQATDIVGMYCYIFREIQEQLKQEVGSEITVLAEQFKHKYLEAESKIFDEESGKQVINILKDTLDIIENSTALKDSDFWYYYEAIEIFLYGELLNLGDGEIWGINNFCNVWESICLTYIAKTISPEQILHLDTQNVANSIVEQINKYRKVFDIAGAFKIKEQKLMPDAVIYSHPFKNLPEIESFIITPDDWDDYSYRTAFKSNLEYFKNYFCNKENKFKIVYDGQGRNKQHTIVELKKYYITSGSKVLIDSQLPSIFYSYWNVEIINPLNKEVFALMKKLNHIFYIALKNGAYCPNTFHDFLAKKVFEKHANYSLEYNLFCDSLLRGHSFRSLEFIENSEDTNEIVVKFKKFIQSLQSTFKIIDIKYFYLEYFEEEENKRKLKEISVRKQFVYEYLLQQHINQDSNFKELEIKSEFWIPKMPHTTRDDIDSYLDGYIRLKQFKLNKMINIYLS
ncbi:conserved hypothetical protein [Calothrix sp. PCC 7716]|nr:conserved hypothetical protein [Calothrix sp. PCC 7716]